MCFTQCLSPVHIIMAKFLLLLFNLCEFYICCFITNDAFLNGEMIEMICTQDVGCFILVYRNAK